MRVLHFIPCLGLAGAEKQLSFLGAGLSRLGVDCHVAYALDYPTDHHNLERLEAAGVTLHRVIRRAVYDPRIVWNVRSLVRRLEPDLVQTWLAMMDIVGGLALRGCGVPWVVSERSTPTLVARNTTMRVRERIVRWSSAVIANSRSGAEAWRRHLGPSHPCHVIPNAIDVATLRKARPADPSERGLPPDAPLIVYVGRLAPLKNVEVLLDALRRALHATDACAVLIGTGPDQDRVEALARDDGLAGRLVAPGFVPDPWPWIRRARVFVSLSRTEGMPNTVMEAVACGCPVVLSDIRPHRDLLPDDCARFVSVSSPGEAAEAIVSLLRDREAANAQADRAMRIADAWSIDAAARAYLAVYRDVVARHAGAPAPGTSSADPDVRWESLER